MCRDVFVDKRRVRLESATPWERSPDMKAEGKEGMPPLPRAGGALCAEEPLLNNTLTYATRSHLRKKEGQTPHEHLGLLLTCRRQLDHRAPVSRLEPAKISLEGRNSLVNLEQHSADASSLTSFVAKCL